MRVLLVEPYYTGSHRAWADGYVEHSQHDVRLITHPGRWWKWRMRGAAVTLARSLESLGSWRPDVVLVSDMVDLTHFRTLARHVVGDVPTAFYFHESQLTYPSPPGARTEESHALINLISAYSADRVFFNSGYHRDVFFDSLPRLLATSPDLRHLDLIGEVEVRSEVLPVGVDLSWVSDRPRCAGVPRILWNHSWEFDKDPEAFADAIEELLGTGADFELILCSPRPARTPPALHRMRDLADERIIHDGAAPISKYRKLLTESELVVSTARQEFFGISVVEAIAAGCRPVLPNRLSYPWLVPERHHEEVLYEEGTLGTALIEALSAPKPPEGLSESMHRFAWDSMGPVYDARLEDLARKGPVRSSCY